jgi:RNase P/RNase MRP subunit p29
MSHKQYKLPEKSILKINLIGQYCEIVYADRSFLGEIKNETKNTWQIMTEKGLKTIPKQDSRLKIQIEQQLYEINGNRMKGRHEDRIKRRLKRKW